jgi:hypothetical protein
MGLVTGVTWTSVTNVTQGRVTAGTSSGPPEEKDDVVVKP